MHLDDAVAFRVESEGPTRDQLRVGPDQRARVFWRLQAHDGPAGWLDLSLTWRCDWLT